MSTDVTSPTSLTISLLGPPQVTLGGVRLSDFKYTKARALLVYLALKAGMTTNRAEIGALLWPEMPESAARRNLTQVLIALRTVLTLRASGQTWLRVDKDLIQLEPELPVVVDVVQFEQLLDDAERHGHQSWRTCWACAQRLESARGLYRGEFLAQFFVPDSAPFEEWALAQRERLRQRIFSALERLAERAEWRGDYAGAIDYARQSAALDPQSEAGQRELMRLLALAGQWTAATNQYEQLRRMLANEFGLAPEAETETLYKDIRQRQPGRLRRYAAPPYNGPVPPNPLIGRGPELEQICTRLRAQDGRVLTLTGTPGLGKTRLALEAARHLRDDFEEGVHVVDLTATREAAEVPAAIARVLGVKEAPGQPVSQTLRARLKNQHALLVLDNFEHVLEAADFVAQLLADCPQVRALITSRIPLRIRSEQQQALAPLDEADAVRLFVARAQAAGVSLELTIETAGAVAAVCARVDRLPLAIELIAGRVQALTLTELQGQLDRPLEALAAGARDGPARHRTLRDAIAWSYARLTEGEQRVFRHLGVLAGGTAATAQALLGQEQPAWDALAALREASLVQTQTVGDQTRFSLLATLRDFALEQLAAQDELADAQARHAAHFLALAEQAEPELEGPEQLAWLDRLDLEHPNLRTALTWSLSHDLEVGLRLAGALWRFWMIRGHLSEGREWLRRLLAEQPVRPVANDQRANALLAEARLAMGQGDFRQGVELAAQSRALYLHLEHANGIARATQTLGHALIDLGDYAASRAHLEEALDLFRSEADRRGLAITLNSLGYVSTRQGNYQEATAFAEQSLALCRELNLPRLAAGLSVNIGMTAMAQGDYATAQRLTEAGLGLLRQLRDTDAVQIVLLNLGNIYHDTGDWERAQDRYEEAIALGRSLRTASIAAPLLGLGMVRLEQGDLDGARACFAEGLQLRLRTGEQRGLALALGSFARLAHARQQPGRAAQLLGAADALRKAIGAPIQPRAQKEYDQLVSDLRAALDATGYDAEWTAGAALTVEQAAALALEV